MRLSIFFFVTFLFLTDANLSDDLNEISGLIPTTQIAAIIARHVIFDPEVQHFRKFLQTKEFESLWDTLVSNKCFNEVVKFAQTSGYNVIGAINQLAALLKVKEYPMFTSIINFSDKYSIKILIEEIYKELPKARISALMQEKIVTSSEFNKFFAVLSSQILKALVEETLVSPEIAEIITILERKGISIDQIICICRDFLSQINYTK